MLRLLAEIMSFLIKAPFRIMAALNLWLQQRAMTSKVGEVVGKEVKTYSRVATFFRYLGLFALLVIGLLAFFGILWFLYWLNAALGLERLLGGPWPGLRPYWLPLLFLLFCVTSFVGYRLYRALGPDRDVVEFADIDEAWAEVQVALVATGIDITSVPLFLILGRTARGASAFMSASKIPFNVLQVPMKTHAPLQVYANRQGIYVFALDACLLSRQAELLHEVRETTEPETTLKSPSLVFEEPAPEVTPVPAPVAPPPPDPLLVSQNLLAEPGVAVLPAPSAAAASPWATPAGRRRMPALVKRTDEVDKYQRRMRYLARRIVRSREPYCPINGVLLLVPFDAIENDDDASQIATLCQQDLQALHDTARTRTPVVVLVSDLETAPGFDALGERLDPDRRLRLFGQDLPLIPDVKPGELPLVLSGSVEHFERALGQWGVRLFRVEQSQQDNAAGITAENTQLFEFMEAIRVRGPGIERVLSRVCLGQPPSEFLLAGFYVAATGTQPEQDQAFVPGVFQQLVQNQNAVAWTNDALAEERDYLRWTTYGYAALAIFLIAVTVMLWLRWQVTHW